MLYHRTPRYEPLEGRRLLALVTVNTLSDTVDLTDGFTSLREAIFATNLVSGSDQIDFASSLTADGQVTILLTQGELRIADDLAIEGPGANLLTIDAASSDPTPDENTGDGSRVFNIDNGDSELFINVTIRGLTLTGGDVLASGGAIRSGEHFTLRDCVVSGSAAVSADPVMLSYGGGIAHRDGLLAVFGSIIADNFGDFGGGIHLDGGQAFLASTSIIANAGQSGAGIYNDGGVAFISRSTIRDNSAGAFSLGGGIYSSGNLSVFDTTISGNSADYGGGVFSRTETVGDNETLIVNSTISGNTAFSRGGGVRNAYGRTTIQFSTITGNTAPPGQGSGIASRGYTSATTRVSHTIIAGNTNSDVDFGTGSMNTFVSRGYNLVGAGNAAAAFQGPGDQTGVANPMLGPLADNGGFTLPDGSRILTHALLPGSPAINTGDLNAKAGMGGIPTYDQRLEPFSRVVNGRIDIGAFEYQAASDLNLVVDTLADESDGNHGHGDLSLREAIELANLYPSDDTIRFDPALTATVPATIVLTRGELRITDDVSIEGSGANLLTIDASGNDPTPGVKDARGSRVFNIIDGLATHSEILISGLRLTGGDVDFTGGAVHSTESLTIRHVVVDNNAAMTGFGDGGGVYSVGPLVVENSRIANNLAGSSTGGITALSGITCLRCEIVGNQGGGIRVRGGEVEIIDTTIADNISGGLGIEVGSQTAVIMGSSISRNVGGGMYLGVASGGTGLVIDTSFIDNVSAFSRGGADINVAPGGQARVEQSRFHNNRAWFGGGLALTGSVQVTDSEFLGNVATFAGLGGGGIYVGETPGESSLVEIRNSLFKGNVATATGGRIGYGGGIHARADLDLIDCVIVDNSANGFGGGIYIQNGASIIVGSLIENNKVGIDGGGIMISSATSAFGLTVNASTIRGNTAGRDGGGLFAFNPVEISNSTVSGNSARNGGGLAIGLKSVVINSTISGNVASGLGGGVWSDFGTALVHSTITGNSAQVAGGGVFNIAGRLELVSSIVAGNTVPIGGAGRDLTGLIGTGITARYSLIGTNDASGLSPSPMGSPDANGNLIGSGFLINAMLGPLADNGGPTMTHALLPDSRAINAGDPAAVAGLGDVPQFDQRGAPFTRVHGGRIDIGAFELQPERLVGDYNLNGVVDAADYLIWRKTLNSTTNLSADGNGDGIVNQDDWQVWRANFGRTAESREQGAGSEERGADSTESAANQAPTRRLAWQPPASPGVSAASRAAFRPPAARFAPADDFLASLTSPRQPNSGRHEFVSSRQQSMRDSVADSADASVHAIDQVFETLGAQM